MRIEVIPQVEMGSIHRVRVGDVLNNAISDAAYQRFSFAAAYMRMSGWDRLAGSIDNLRNRGGSISGAVGIDQKITTIEALEALSRISMNSTIFYTVSGFIYHPKLYLMSGTDQAIAVVGSANLTRDGLFRNVELSTAIYLDFHSGTDLSVYQRYDTFIDELLDTSNPNVQSITPTTLRVLADSGLINNEAQMREPGPAIRSRRARRQARTDLDRLFPALSVPVPPPAVTTPTRVVMPPRTVGTAATFVMQLSAFDCSHRTDVPGTPEVLIPHGAIGFFPRLSSSGRRYPDAIFDVVLNTPTGYERHSFRLWYYEQRATGTRIDEYRLRMNHDVVDLSNPTGGDLLIINKLPPGSSPAYEVTILPQSDPTFPDFLGLCRYTAQGKRWGLA